MDNKELVWHFEEPRKLVTYKNERKVREKQTSVYAHR